MMHVSWTTQKKPEELKIQERSRKISFESVDLHSFPRKAGWTDSAVKTISVRRKIMARRRLEKTFIKKKKIRCI